MPYGSRVVCGLAAGLLLVLPCFAMAAEVAVGEIHMAALSAGRTWQWQVVGQGDERDGLRVEERLPNGTTRPLSQHDLSDCRFCAGDDDNCVQDGVAVREVTGYPGPVVTVMCHVGAHGQRFAIFDPAKGSEPIFRVAGTYWADARIEQEAIVVQYDERQPCGTDDVRECFATVTATWPLGDEEGFLVRERRTGIGLGNESGPSGGKR